MYQQLQSVTSTVPGVNMVTPPGIMTTDHTSTGLYPSIPYDRNLYLTVTSPDGQDKEILGSKELLNISHRYSQSGIISIEWKWLNDCTNPCQIFASVFSRASNETGFSDTIFLSFNQFQC